MLQDSQARAPQLEKPLHLKTSPCFLQLEKNLWEIVGEGKKQASAWGISTDK